MFQSQSQTMVCPAHERQPQQPEHQEDQREVALGTSHGFDWLSPEPLEDRVRRQSSAQLREAGEDQASALRRYLEPSLAPRLRALLEPCPLQARPSRGPLTRRLVQHNQLP